MSIIPKVSYGGKMNQSAGSVSLGSQLDASAFGGTAVKSTMELAQAILGLSSTLAQYSAKEESLNWIGESHSSVVAKGFS